jgi:hypothetical protein
VPFSLVDEFHRQLAYSGRCYWALVECPQRSQILKYKLVKLEARFSLGPAHLI